MIRSLCIAAACGLMLVGPCATSATGQTGSRSVDVSRWKPGAGFEEGADMLDAPVINDTLDFMLSKHLRHSTDDRWEEGYPGSELTSALRGYLQMKVRDDGGPELRDAALDRLASRDPDLRRRAMLVLQMFEPETIPLHELQRLADSDRPEHWVWALLWDDRLQPEEPEQLDTSLCVLGTERTDDAVRDVVDEYVALRTLGEDTEGLKDEYVEAHRTVLEPNLSRLPEFAPAEERIHLDFDGDGIEEVFFHAQVPSDWYGGEHVFALLRQRRSTYEIAWIETWVFAPSHWSAWVHDTDEDGRPELALVLGGANGSSLTLFDEGRLQEPHEASGRRVAVLKHPRTGRVVFVTGRSYNDTSGFARYASAIGGLWTVWMPRPEGEVETVAVHTRDLVW